MRCATSVVTPSPLTHPIEQLAADPEFLGTSYTSWILSMVLREIRAGVGSHPFADVRSAPPHTKRPVYFSAR